MINNIKIQHLVSLLLVTTLSLFVNAALAGEPVVDEAKALANQFQTMSDTIGKNSQELTSPGLSESIVNVSSVSRIKAIMNDIESQRKKLVELVMGKTTFNAADSAMLDNILHKLEAKRSALATYLVPHSEPTANLVLPTASVTGLQQKDKTLQVFTAH
jgi:hypothetical protein